MRCTLTPASIPSAIYHCKGICSEQQCPKQLHIWQGDCGLGTGPHPKIGWPVYWPSELPNLPVLRWQLWFGFHITANGKKSKLEFAICPVP
jgi:hypothetical protein